MFYPLSPLCTISVAFFVLYVIQSYLGEGYVWERKENKMCRQLFGQAALV